MIGKARTITAAPTLSALTNDPAGPATRWMCHSSFLSEASALQICSVLGTCDAGIVAHGTHHVSGVGPWLPGISQASVARCSSHGTPGRCVWHTARALFGARTAARTRVKIDSVLVARHARAMASATPYTLISRAPWLPLHHGARQDRFGAGCTPR